MGILVCSAMEQILSTLRRAHKRKARSWWQTRTSFLQKLKTENDLKPCITSRNARNRGQKRIYVKAMQGKGIKKKLGYFRL